MNCKKMDGYFRNVTCFWILAFALLYASCGGDDIVTITNSNSDAPVGMLIDGEKTGSQIDDQTVVTSVSNQNIGKFDAPGTGGEIIGFTSGRPMKIVESVPWTMGSDLVEMKFENLIELPVTVWILAKPFDEIKIKSAAQIAFANQVFQGERMGVRLVLDKLHDETLNPKSNKFQIFSCDMRSELEATIGKKEGQINIYYVATMVDGPTISATCEIGGDFVVMGPTGNLGNLVHEICHDFALTHVNDDLNFDILNVMHNQSNNQLFLSEGQIFRAHTHLTSAINDTYDARHGLPTRDCPVLNVGGFKCLPIQKRIFADGLLQPN